MHSSTITRGPNTTSRTFFSWVLSILWVMVDREKLMGSLGLLEKVRLGPSMNRHISCYRMARERCVRSGRANFSLIFVLSCHLC